MSTTAIVNTTLLNEWNALTFVSYDDVDKSADHHSQCKNVAKLFPGGGVPKTTANYLPIAAHPQDNGATCPACRLAQWIRLRQKYEAGTSDHDDSHVTRLTAAQLEFIKHDPRTQIEIAKEYGITQSRVSQIKKSVVG
jgi:hypothetical protein